MSWIKKVKLLEKIIIDNSIFLSKGSGYTVPVPIEAKIIKIREVQTSLKSTHTLGFLGTFSINFEIPDYWDREVGVNGGKTIKRVN